MLKIAVAIFMSSLSLHLVAMDSSQAKPPQNPPSLKMLAARALPQAFDASRLPLESRKYVAFITKHTKNFIKKNHEHIIIDAIQQDNAQVMAQILNMFGIIPESGTLLITAVQCDSVKCLKLFIDVGINVDYLWKCTVDWSHPDLIDRFNPRYYHKEHPAEYSSLMLAALSNKVECLKILIDGGATLDLENFSHETALILAAFKGHNECAHALLEAGASSSFRAITLAEIHKNTKTAQMLRNARAKKIL